MKNKIEQIAKTCHAVHRTYCDAIGHDTQPEWEATPIAHQLIVMDSIERIITGNIASKEESHENFVKLKIIQGWSYGATYSKEHKTNPRLVPFKELKLEDRIKESLFFEVVQSFKSK